MKKLLNLKLTFLKVFLFCTSLMLAQTTISGKVVDSNETPLSGVNIVLEGTSKGSISDFDGNYTIAGVENGSYTLKATSIGFASFSTSLNAEGSTIIINIQLEDDEESLNEVIVTGVANPRAKIESSVSITSLQPSKINQSAPRSTAEIFRTIPGIRSESSGGEGNSNIAVRGVPISSGGSKYVQIQEDGLPVLLYGDISFGTADIFTRFDANVKKIEAIRGGSASTMSSNSPGGIINIISKTGKNQGGSLSTTFGLDYNSFRTDFDYGSKIGDGLYFHMGGFYRAGEGVRKAGYTANNGGQFKLNLTKEFDNGYVRLYTKYLNDRAAGYLPLPMAVSGTNADPSWDNAPNFDATTGAIHSAFLTQNFGTGVNGEPRRSKVSDGMHPVSSSVGFEAFFELENNWTIKNNGRFSFNSGRFVSPFPAQLGTAADMASSFGAGSTLQYTSGASVADNSLVARIHMFDTELNDFNNFMNDFKLSKSFENLDLTFGYFKSIQNVSMSWLWSSYLLEVNGDNGQLIDVFDTAGNALSENGLYAYGTPFWGNLHRNYDTQYNVSAPYLSLNFDATENLNIDASIRHDNGRVRGSFAGGSSSAIDMNNDGVISAPEQDVYSIDHANATAVDYDYDYFSYSLGVNYKLQDNKAVFARISKGASAKADRILFSGLDYTNGDRINALDFISQIEVGYKQKFERGALYATFFSATTNEEGGFEATSNSIIENDYKSMGIEVEGSYNISDKFNLRGALTWTDAEINSGANEGKTPRRQPDFIYNIIPTYSFGQGNQNLFGLSLIGQSKAYAQDSNELVMPGFVMVNSFIDVAVTKSLTANLSVNNLFDTIGVTESEEGSITEGQVNYLRARPLPGRSMSLALRYTF